MKTWKRALALVLALVMALSLVALPSFAEGEEESAGNDGMPYIEENGHGGTVTKDGLVMSKTIKKTGDSQFLLTPGGFRHRLHHHHCVQGPRGHRPGPGRLRLDGPCRIRKR